MEEQASSLSKSAVHYAKKGVAMKRLASNHLGLIVVLASGCMISASEAYPGLDVSEDDTAFAKSTSLDLSASSCVDGDDIQRGRARIFRSPGVTGHIEISDFFIGGAFYADDTIIRSTAHPECVLHIQSSDEKLANVGTLTITSDLVGAPGGPMAPFVIGPDWRNEYYAFPDPEPLFNFPDGGKVQFSLTGAPGFPGIPKMTLRTPKFDNIKVTAPVPDANWLVSVPIAESLTFEWDVASADKQVEASQRQHVSVRLFLLGPVNWGQLYCTWSATAGIGELPGVLLREFRSQVGGTGFAEGVLDVYVGEIREIATSKSSYVAFATTDNAATTSANGGTIYRSISALLY